MTGHNEAGITVYWRPGCPFCSRLRRKLARAGVITTESTSGTTRRRGVVRSVAGGNETVPTVTVGTATFVCLLAPLLKSPFSGKSLTRRS